MKKENKTRFVILGLLLDQSRTGYEIGEFIQESTVNFWQESDASIYPTLKILAKEGKVTSKTEHVGKRKKELFSITEKGKKEFQEWFKRPAEPDTRRHEFLLKLFFASTDDEEEMQEHFKRRFSMLQEVLKNYKNTEKELESMPLRTVPRKDFWLKTLRNGIAHTELEIAWVKKELQT